MPQSYILIVYHNVVNQSSSRVRKNSITSPSHFFTVFHVITCFLLILLFQGCRTIENYRLHNFIIFIIRNINFNTFWWILWQNWLLKEIIIEFTLLREQSSLEFLPGLSPFSIFVVLKNSFYCFDNLLILLFCSIEPNSNALSIRVKVFIKE